MSYSRTETAALIQRAAIGAGLCAGLAEEIADACLWLTQRGGPGAAAALAGLERPAAAAEMAERLDQALAAEAAAGAGETAQEVRFDAAAAPLLALGLAGLRAERLGLGVSVTGTDGRALRPEMALTGPMDLRVRFSPAAGDDPDVAGPGQEAGQEAGRCVIDGATYRGLTVLARRTLVPASESSRASGAGAGAPDSD